MAEKLVAVELEFYDTDLSAVATLRLCSTGPLSTAIGATHYQYHPALDVPILVGARLDVQNYEQPISGVAEGGTIRFAIDDVTRPYLTSPSYALIGRSVKIYEGNVGDSYAALTLVYTGRAQGLTHDTRYAQVRFTDARLDFDQPLQGQLYDDTAPDALIARPKPFAIGTCYSVGAALDFPPNKWRLSTERLVDIMAVRVGQVAWDEVAPPPAQGQYSEDAVNVGMFDLGGSTENGEVRADIRSEGYETVTTGSLMQQLVTGAGGQVDAARFAELNAICPWLIGYARFTDPINQQEAFDDIMAATGGWYVGTPAGQIAAGAIAIPVAGVGTPSLTEIEIAEFEQVALIPPAWRVRVEYKRNWQPATQAFASVPEETAAAAASGGVLAPEWSDSKIKTANPRASDPLIRSMVHTEGDAMAIRDRLATAWRKQRRLYNVAAYMTFPAIYSVVAVNYRGVVGDFRVVAASRSIGGGPHRLQLWG